MTFRWAIAALHDDVDLRSRSSGQRVDDLVHQRHDLVGVGAVVLERPVGPGDADRPGPPQARILVALEVAGVEVEIEDHAVRASRNDGSTAIVPTWSIARA